MSPAEKLEEMYKVGCAHLRTLFDENSENSVSVHLFKGGHKILRFQSANDYKCDGIDPESEAALKERIDGFRAMTGLMGLTGSLDPAASE